MSLLKNFLVRQSARSLYIILDQETCKQYSISMIDVYKICCAEGIRLFQYRDKRSKGTEKDEFTEKFFEQVSLIDRASETMVILNDDLQLAVKLGVPVHLGQQDLPFKFGLSNQNGIASLGYGASSHNASELERLQYLSEYDIGPDYSAFGAVFPSPSKPDVEVHFSELELFFKMNPSLYSVLIGGITPTNIERLNTMIDKLAGSGKTFYAVISGIFLNGSTEAAIRKTIRQYLNVLP